MHAVACLMLSGLPACMLSCAPKDVGKIAAHLSVNARGFRVYVCVSAHVHAVSYVKIHAWDMCAFEKKSIQ
jgi:hypothetical protein